MGNVFRVVIFVQEKIFSSLRLRDMPPIVGLTTRPSAIFNTLTIFFYILGVIFVGLRVYARRLIGKTLAIDDYLIFFALVGISSSP